MTKSTKIIMSTKIIIMQKSQKLEVIDSQKGVNSI